MSRPPKHQLSHRDQIATALTADIVSGRRVPGAKLPSLRWLAKQFHTGRTPVEQAIAILAAQGYVLTRQGAGVFVRDARPGLSLSDSVLLCMSTTGHVYGDLTRLLCDRLNTLGLLPTLLDPSRANADTVRRAQYSDARFMVACTGATFPLAEARTIGNKHMIAVLTWEFDTLLDCVHRILVDHAAGMRLLADHLWAAGHRRVLLAGTPNMITHAAEWDGQDPCPLSLNVQGTGFATFWIRRGGHAIPFHCHHERQHGPACEMGALLAIMAAPNAPTAVVGLRDVDAWDVKSALRRHSPLAFERVAFFGSGDTPWSQNAKPPFSSLNWNLEQIADLTVGIIRDVQAGKVFKKPVVRMIAPRFVERGANGEW